jgi:PQQ-dependent dehydrogenase (methanol/ethanol family)
VRRSIPIALWLALLSGCGLTAWQVEEALVGVDAIDDERLRDADAEAESWLSYGRTYAEQRFSPLAQIDDTNVGGLGLAWAYETGSKRGLEATPLVADGVIYTTSSWSVVHAVDARTGQALWRHDPKVPRRYGSIACCDVVNRGVALYRGRVLVGTLDGRLLALDAKSGAVVWSQLTVDPSRPYTITMAPRVVEGNVIIGNGGAEFGVRGYVSAYDAMTGRLVWRFYTVPGNPRLGFENEALAHAATTWTGEWWEVGGGGTVWDSIAFDPELDLLYVGTGNGSPWSRYIRSPDGGDNLYVSSILALRPETGELVWHYQTTPGDNWDYTSTQHMLLADLEIDGEPRKVLMQAPKNGFFYVLDRASGELLSADPFATVTWATGVDLETGRPIEAPGLDYRDKKVEVKPSPYGAHNWHPMSFHPETGLVYVPVNDIPYFFKLDKNWKHRTGAWNTGTDFNVADEFPRELVSGHLLAWDPVAKQEVWRAQYTSPWNGGTLATAGNLVFQGTAHGTFAAYRASDGALLFEAPAGTGIVAPPVTYSLDGEQYVAVMAGWGGAFALVAGDAAAAAGVTDNTGRLLVWKLGGTARLPELEAAERELAALDVDADAETVQHGNQVYHRWCGTCHGTGAVSGGVLPDLRKSEPGIYEIMDDIVLRGALLQNGMPRFDVWLRRDDVASIRAYLLSRRAALFAAKE